MAALSVSSGNEGGGEKRAAPPVSTPNKRTRVAFILPPNKKAEEGHEKEDCALDFFSEWGNVEDYLEWKKKSPIPAFVTEQNEYQVIVKNYNGSIDPEFVADLRALLLPQEMANNADFRVMVDEGSEKEAEEEEDDEEEEEKDEDEEEQGHVREEHSDTQKKD